MGFRVRPLPGTSGYQRELRSSASLRFCTQPQSQPEGCCERMSDGSILISQVWGICKKSYQYLNYFGSCLVQTTKQNTDSQENRETQITVTFLPQSDRKTLVKLPTSANSGLEVLDLPGIRCYRKKSKGQLCIKQWANANANRKRGSEDKMEGKAEKEATAFNKHP